MKRKFVLSLLLLFTCLFAAPIPAFADMGPKPSVSVYFRNMKQKNCYVTLLAKEESTGPQSVYSPSVGNKYISDDGTPEIWQKFVDYKDPDGYHFLQFYQKLGDDSFFHWGYYPPVKFKILLYFPDYKTFAVSKETYELYAFSSTFAVDASTLGVGPVADGTTFFATPNFNYEGNALSLLVRMLITIVIELLIALPFGYLAKQQLGFIASVNMATQIILNVLLNLVNFKYGGMTMRLSYVLLELLVFAIEAAIYSHSATLVKYAKAPKKPHPVVYAFVANLASYVAGLELFFAFPQYF